MKKYLTIISILSLQHIQAQNLANTWEFSYSTDLVYPNSEITFNGGVANIDTIFRIMSFNLTNASISDSNGNLLFYTNGITIGNKNYDTLENAVNFNQGSQTTIDDPDGLRACQGALFLPAPGSKELYYVIYITGETFFANAQFETQPLHLSYSVIDRSLENGNGAIIDSLKNIHLLDDTLTWGRLTACKHANGRDWWVIAHHYYSNKYYKFLVSPNGVAGPYEQEIGSVVTNDIVGQATFSPDGSKFAMVSPENIIDYFQFDRCSGDFFSAKQITSPDTVYSIGGCSFSPNSRFLYISSKHNIYQYDTWDTSMQSVIHIATWDSFTENGIPVVFFNQQLAPDNKIYIGPFNGVSYLNVINSPDSLGLACDFAPHSIKLPQYNWNVPSFPNYDLGALDGSPCDTLYLPTNSSFEIKARIRLYPNPTSDWFSIVYQFNDDALFELFDMFGKQVAATSLLHYFRNRLVNVSELPIGLYLASVTQRGKRVWSEKVMVER